jgi:hypothetical protein
MSVLVMPDVYGPQGEPLYWKNDTTGLLGAIINKYLRKDPQEPLDWAEWVSLRSYVVHWINAPGFQDSPEYQFLAKLRLRARTMTIEEFAEEGGADSLLAEALEIGIDPF